MMLEIPFCKNSGDGKQCMQAAMQCVLKYFLNKDYSLGELDKLTKRKAGLWTWISQMALALHDLGLDIKLYSKTDLEPFLEGEPFIRKHFGADAGKILKFADLPVAIELGVLRKDISSFQVEVPADQLYQNIITARKIVETSKKEICLTCFSDLAKENDLFVNILPSFNNTYIYDIKDSNYIINNEQYHLRFAIQYES